MHFNKVVILYVFEPTKIVNDVIPTQKYINAARSQLDSNDKFTTCVKRQKGVQSFTQNPYAKPSTPEVLSPLDTSISKYMQLYSRDYCSFYTNLYTVPTQYETIPDNDPISSTTRTLAATSTSSSPSRDDRTDATTSSNLPIRTTTGAYKRLYVINKDDKLSIQIYGSTPPSIYTKVDYDTTTNTIASSPHRNELKGVYISQQKGSGLPLYIANAVYVSRNKRYYVYRRINKETYVGRVV